MGFAETTGGVSDSQFSVLLLALEKHDYDTAEAQSRLRAIADKLPLTQRYDLYERYKVSPLWGLLNFYFVGSLFQGDGGTSAIMFGGYVGGVLVASASAGTMSFADRPEAAIWLVTGAAIAGGSYLYGLIRPWFFADEKNAKLKSVLFGSEDTLPTGLSSATEITAPCTLVNGPLTPQVVLWA